MRAGASALSSLPRASPDASPDASLDASPVASVDASALANAVPDPESVCHMPVHNTVVRAPLRLHSELSVL